MDQFLGSAVTFDDVAFQEFFAVPGEWHKVVCLYLKKGRQESEVVKIFAESVSLGFHSGRS